SAEARPPPAASARLACLGRRRTRGAGTPAPRTRRGTPGTPGPRRCAARRTPPRVDRSAVPPPPRAPPTRAPAERPRPTSPRCRRPHLPHLELHARVIRVLGEPGPVPRRDLLVVHDPLGQLQGVRQRLHVVDEVPDRPVPVERRAHVYGTHRGGTRAHRL